MQTSYDISVVLQSLETRLGWLNPSEAGYGIVSCANTETKSGLYFNDDTFHPACNVQYIKDCQPDPDITDDNFNDYLSRLRRSNVLDVVNKVFNQSSYVEDGMLYESTEHMSFNGIRNSGTFVGIRIIPEKDHVVNLKNVIFHFDGDAEFTLYLHHQFVGKVASWKIKVKAYQQYSFPIDTAIMYNSSTAKGGIWFLSYDQTELGNVKAIDYNPCVNDFVCMSALSFQSLRKGAESFDMLKYSTTTNMYGMNIEVSNYQDVTQKILRNNTVFDTLLGLMMASKAIDIIQNTSRSNEKERITKELMVHLYREQNNVTTAENPFAYGMRSRISKELSRVSKIFFPKPKTSIADLC